MPDPILIIEDNGLHRRVYSAAVGAHGFDAIEIADEREAVDIATASSSSAIIVDIRLPHIDGRTLISQLRQQEKVRDTPIIAVSAFSEFHLAESCISAGADSFHAKPVRLQTLIDDIKKLISERLN